MLEHEGSRELNPEEVDRLKKRILGIDDLIQKRIISAGAIRELKKDRQAHLQRLIDQGIDVSELMPKELET